MKHDDWVKKIDMAFENENPFLTKFFVEELKDDVQAHREFLQRYIGEWKIESKEDRRAKRMKGRLFREDFK